jgi:hypothetical protein
MMFEPNKNLSRREFFALGGKAAATAAMMNMLPNVMASPSANFPKGKA